VSGDPGRPRIGFLGPLGTFTEQALKSQPDLAAGDHILFRTMPDVLDAVGSGEVDLGFVAIENSIEGTVNLTQDELAFNHDLLIQREVVLDIEHCLMARPGTALADVKVVYSIPVATRSATRSCATGRARRSCAHRTPLPRRRDSSRRSSARRRRRRAAHRRGHLRARGRSSPTSPTTRQPDAASSSSVATASRRAPVTTAPGS
jgi:hypothetical protein